MKAPKHTLASKSKERSNEDLMIEEYENQQEEIRNSGVSSWVEDIIRPINRMCNSDDLIERSNDIID